KIIKGDIFETPADIRINTVNCVGVMGAGVALAFKNKYPEMFRDYQKDCKAGKVKPGQLHIWKNLLGDWVINLPTKRHWREPSRYDDIEAGLKALRDYLIEQTKEHPSLRIALPALGCGHGGLDWKRVSQMIREHLSDLEAEIFVFEPSASRLAGQKIENGEDEESLEKLQSMGVVVIDPGHEKYPEALRGKSAAIFYAKGNLNILDSAFLAVLPSGKPSEREVNAATGCIEAIAQPGVTFLVGYGPAIERPSIRIALQKGADVALFLPDGIINFRVRQDLQDIWDEDRIIVLTAAKPNQKWNPSLAFRARDLQLTLAKAVLITDPAPDWLSRLLKKRNPSQTPSIFYVNYSTDDFPTKSIFRNFRAFPIGRSVDSGKPNVAPIIECLDILRAPVSIETDLPVTETYAHEAQIPEISGQVHEAPAEQAFSEKQSQLDGTPRYPKRLIEVDLPIKRISAHARREKSIRHGHICTLHIWWARRPLAACRAVICASLWPDPVNELCPGEFRKTARELMTKWAKDHLKLISEESSRRFIAISKDDSKLNDNVELRKALLDFIADFANWDNSNNEEYIKTSQILTKTAHVSLGGEIDTLPLVVDSFAGGGAIPLEALRTGANAFASDLNPIPVLLNKIQLEYIPKYGRNLSAEIQKWGQWIKKQAKEQLATFYPSDPNGTTPIAYLWARTIISEAPDDGTGIPVEVPLMRSMWLAKKQNGSFAMRWVTDSNGKVKSKINKSTYFDGSSLQVRQPLIEIFRPKNISEVGNGSVTRGAATCPISGYTTPVNQVRKQLKLRFGGTKDARMLAIRCGDRSYRSPDTSDLEAIQKAQLYFQGEYNKIRSGFSIFPDEPTPTNKGHRAVGSPWIYGMRRWQDLFTCRQLTSIDVINKLIRKAEELIKNEYSSELSVIILTILGLAASRLTDFLSSLCRLNYTGGRGVANTFGRQALQMVWDFMESNPLNLVAANWDACISAAVDTINHESVIKLQGTAIQENATQHLLPDDSAQCFITDPPYYDSIPYADLADYFYVWLKRSIGHIHKDLFSEKATPKKEQAVVLHPQSSSERINFELKMTLAMAEGRRILQPSGIGVVVFAHKSTKGWETQLQAMINAGWIITGSWPIDTERGGRVNAQGTASLASSIHLICRPRENVDGSLRENDVGDWRDVLSELPKRIHEWIPHLAEEGVVGADAIFACLGPALEIYSRYSSVEKASGEKVELKEYLEQVWAAVSREALKMIFEGADASGFEEDARLTAMWLW
ncbi:MAG: DUF1156 domain-containing protein, partial [Desulfobacteraceae bacterium]|nr:DUF1156 domain-containing protein [Desulfobacteraceae bacterium]